MKKKVIALLCAVLMLAVVFTGCGGKKLKGEWKQIVNGTEIYGLTFTDSTVEMFTAGVSIGKYEYKVVDKDTLKVTLAGVETEWSYSLDGDTLSLTVPTIGTAIELTRQ